MRSASAGELEASELGAVHPADVLAEQRRRFARHLATEEVKLDPPVAVVVSDAQELLTDFGTAAELFENLAAQARGLGFSSLALAAGKLPHAFEVGAAKPPRHEIALAALHDGGSDDDRGLRHARCPG